MATNYTAEIKRMTLDPGACRLGEIADVLAAKIAKIRKDCCPDVSLSDKQPEASAVPSSAAPALSAAPVPAPASATKATKKR